MACALWMVHPFHGFCSLMLFIAKFVQVSGSVPVSQCAAQNGCIILCLGRKVLLSTSCAV